MLPVTREELLDYVTYGERRDALRAEVLAKKAPRRVMVGDFLAFLFENRDTVRYQVHEMLRAEAIVKEAEIRHELDTYNELLGGQGELGATLMIELEDPAVRAEKLKELLDLPEHVYVRLEGGRKVRPTFDRRQVGGDRLSSVQFLKFDTRGEVPVAVGVDLPALALETPLAEEQRQALLDDLSD